MSIPAQESADEDGGEWELLVGKVKDWLEQNDLAELWTKAQLPLRVVGGRPERVGLLIAMALRFIPVLIDRADRIRAAQAARGGAPRGLRALRTTVAPLLVQLLQMAHDVSEALDARGADDVPARRPGRA